MINLYPDQDQIKPSKIADKLVDYGAQEAFKLFRNPKFRDLANFSKIPQLEQDRIFNELVLAGVILPMFIFEAPDLRIPEDFKNYLLAIKEEMPKGLIRKYTSLGIEEEHLKDWRKLIKMRYEEYDEDKLKARQAAMEFEAKKAEYLTTKQMEDIQLILPSFTIAVGCHHHICRSKTKGKDELFKLILRWLNKMYIEIRVPAEGGKITLWKKVYIKLKRFINKLT